MPLPRPLFRESLFEPGLGTDGTLPPAYAIMRRSYVVMLAIDQIRLLPSACSSRHLRLENARTKQLSFQRCAWCDTRRNEMRQHFQRTTTSIHPMGWNGLAGPRWPPCASYILRLRYTNRSHHHSKQVIVANVRKGGIHKGP